MHALVAHHYWDRPGGRQLVCASVAKAFDAMGYKVVLSSVPRFEFRDKYVEWFGIDLSKYVVDEVFDVRLKAFGIYLRLLLWLSIKKAFDKYEVDVAFTDECTYKPIEKIIKKKRVRFIEYIHFPMELSVNPKYRGSGLYYDEDPYVLERYNKFPMNIYWWGYVKLLPLFLRRNPFEVASLVLANSRWTAELCRQIYGEKPEVLNPPIAPSINIIERPAGFDKRINAIVMLGRFSEEKRYHWVVNKLMPLLKREVKDVKLYIFGGAKTRTSLAYLGRIEHLARSSNFKVSRSINEDADVYLIPDAPRDVINKIMDKAKAFLHATVNEHWGIAVAEAMARGLPAIVHKSGGLWSDLVESGAYGLGYNNLNEAVEALIKLLSDERTWNCYSYKSLKKARSLTIEEFLTKLSMLMKSKV